MPNDDVLRDASRRRDAFEMALYHRHQVRYPIITVISRLTIARYIKPCHEDVDFLYESVAA